jgi:hypothetical protein
VNGVMRIYFIDSAARYVLIFIDFVDAGTGYVLE